MPAPFSPAYSLEDEKKLDKMLSTKTEEELHQWLQEISDTIKSERRAYDNMGHNLGFIARLFYNKPPMDQTVMGRVTDACIAASIAIREELKRRGEK